MEPAKNIVECKVMTMIQLMRRFNLSKSFLILTSKKANAMKLEAKSLSKNAFEKFCLPKIFHSANSTMYPDYYKNS